MRSEARRVVVSGLGFPECPRWHDGELWFSDFVTKRVSSVDASGAVAVRAEVEGTPSGLGWLPDGRLLVVSMTDRRVLRLDDGNLVTHADLSGHALVECNDMVVDGRGNAYVGSFGFDVRATSPEPRPAPIVLVRPDGDVHVVDEQAMFPNGSAVTADGSTLIVAETFGGQLTAFDIDADGMLSGRRTWAPIPGRAPDGLCLDADGAVWFADAAANACVRVAEGGEVLEIISTGDRGCFACMLGGDDGRSLFLCITDEFSEAAMLRRTATIEAIEVAVPGAGWP